eukprot:TRINITY_DN20159_c0_g1_i1.p1 TRINITY_DN20159_c0_g1~~TRINITY_DN20159_c0_g1_i1.p1  ORF type:complete len:1052 (-),score=194.38 TRINITY_DN20159_c0_g1_i1:847-4002(-)
MASWKRLGSLVLLACACSVVGALRYETSGRTVEGKINVHLVPHSHDDVGWLKTVDQYYYGSNSSLQVAAVQFILDTVVKCLAENPHRRFIEVEQAFFQRWWREQDDDTRDVVRDLVKSGQLEFINGGWCMHDEATTHYVDMIDQTTLGHRYIREQFGKDAAPRIGWQIDPFGHSSTQASLLSAEVGFDGLFFARADYADITKRRKEQSMEFVWRASPSMGASQEVFTGIFNQHYHAPTGFLFELHTLETEPIQDDPDMNDFNVQQRVDAFVEIALAQAKNFKTDHILWPMGEDFAYSNAWTWYKNLDKIIHYVNKDGRVHALYSTPSIYVDAKHDANETWPVKTDDFFPYSDCPHCYWTGYFASRTALKGYVRSLSGFLQAARQLEFFHGRVKKGPTTDSLEEAMAIAQHHDAVSGTEKQHVADDYAERLARGAAEAGDVVNRALLRLTEGRVFNQPTWTERVQSALAWGPAATSEDADSMFTNHRGFKFEQCALLNISHCPASESVDENKTLVVVAYNPLAWSRKQYVRIPVATSKLCVKDGRGNAIPSQAVPLDHATIRLRANAGIENDGRTGALFSLLFEAEAPPLGFSTYFISTPQNEEDIPATVSEIEDVTEEGGVGTVSLGAGHVEMTVARSTGRLLQFVNRLTASNTTVDQSYLWYNGSDGNTVENPGQASGAYIFRPNSSSAFPIWNKNGIVETQVLRGPLMDEVWQKFAPWMTQVIRTYRETQHAEVEFTVGPIPIKDGLGKEVIIRLDTDIASGGVLYTDSNGRDMIKRVLNHRDTWDLEVYEPVAGNYYPINAAAYLGDDKTQLSVLTDRSLGGASLSNGSMEIMLHRRLLHDDRRGVSENLNETVCTGTPTRCEGLTVRGTLHVNLNPPKEAVRWRRTHAQHLLLPLQLSFALEEGLGSDQWLNTHKAHYSSLKAGVELPPNVHLLTLQELADGKILLRLAHIYEKDEDSELGKPVTVNLGEFFADRCLDSLTELTLTANLKKKELRRHKWHTEKPEEPASSDSQPWHWFGVRDFNVKLVPMEIRTFSVRFKTGMHCVM